MQTNTSNTENKRIPIHGSMTRPASPSDAAAEMKAGRVKWAGGDLTVNVETNEFTSVCPTTGQPDFNTIEIAYRPDEFYLESKTIKFYLWAFRDYGAHCETLAKTICDHVFEACAPHEASVVVRQNPRGGLGIVSRFTRQREARDYPTGRDDAAALREFHNSLFSAVAEEEKTS